MWRKRHAHVGSSGVNGGVAERITTYGGRASASDTRRYLLAIYIPTRKESTIFQQLNHLLRLESLALLAAAVALYAVSGAPWWAFAAFLLVPDVSMLGYTGGPRTGAIAYNVAHAQVLPLLLLVVAAVLMSEALAAAAAVWLAHIGLDRALGYGLKAPTGFHDTHLGRIGKRA